MNKRTVTFDNHNNCYVITIVNRRNQKYKVMFEDEKLLKYNWMIGSRGYAEAKIERKSVKMHRLILNAQKGQFCDHVNGNKVDNRRSNLRIVTHRQNIWNKKNNSNSKSKYRGVWYFEDRDKWGVRINGKYGGSFDDEVSAAKRANELMKECYGEFAQLNKLP